MLESGEITLELTEHQKAMLKPPEDRIAEIKFPKSISDRVQLVRKSHRKSRWGSKFKNQLVGKSAMKWAKRLKVVIG